MDMDDNNWDKSKTTNDNIYAPQEEKNEATDAQGGKAAIPDSKKGILIKSQLFNLPQN